MHYLEGALDTRVDTIWIARDLGYRSGRRTGIPMTDELRLKQAAALMGGTQWDRATLGPPVAERTSTVVWHMLGASASRRRCGTPSRFIRMNRRSRRPIAAIHGQSGLSRGRSRRRWSRWFVPDALWRSGAMLPRRLPEAMFLCAPCGTRAKVGRGSSSRGCTRFTGSSTRHCSQRIERAFERGIFRVRPEAVVRAWRADAKRVVVLRARSSGLLSRARSRNLHEATRTRFISELQRCLARFGSPRPKRGPPWEIPAHPFAAS